MKGRQELFDRPGPVCQVALAQLAQHPLPTFVRRPSPNYHQVLPPPLGSP